LKRFDAFFFQQALLEGVATIAGGGVGHLALCIDNPVPQNITSRIKVLEHAADKAGALGIPARAATWP
jgi:hypothetical protein